MTSELIPTSESFAVEIERLVRAHQISYFDAIMLYCDKTDREYETVVPLLTSTLRGHLTREAAANHLLKDKTIGRDALG